MTFILVSQDQFARMWKAVPAERRVSLPWLMTSLVLFSYGVNAMVVPRGQVELREFKGDGELTVEMILSRLSEKKEAA